MSSTQFLDTISAVMTPGLADQDGKVRIAYFDDQLLFREALVAVLEESSDVTVAQSSGQGGHDIRTLLDTPISAILIALDAQSNDPMATLRAVHDLVPELPMCALVAVDRLDRARDALAAGCKGAVSTAATLNVLVAAIENLARGQAYVDPMLGGRLLAKSKNVALRNAKSDPQSECVREVSHVSKN